jgi:mannan endo-1,4-beta-mannosidase
MMGNQMTRVKSIFIWILILCLPLCSADIFLEAETAVLQGVQVSQSATGYSGSGYITGFDNDGDRVIFNFNAGAGLYELTIGYATPYGEKGYDLWVNGAKSTGLFPSSSGAFLTCTAGKYVLLQGQNSIIIGKGWGWFDIDFISLTITQVESPLKPPNRLIDKKATGSARALFSFLIEQYGQKVLSGQFNINDIEYIRSITGKEPAIGCFDLIEYSPSRIEYGSNPFGSVENWIDWVKDDALVSLMWHWNAPTDLINQPGQEWWRGFYTDATAFDLAAALSDKNSSRYKLLLRDMDAIAAQLKKFQSRNIPVLWRPLHEASGGWFWWGAKGPQPFIELWRLMVDRFTTYHQLHNLIWVYTHGDPSWYPGDAYTDIVSLDIYTDVSSSMSGEWENTQKEFNGRKLVALSESGTLLDPDNIRTFKTWWSWFSVWTGSFIRDANQYLLIEVYRDADIMTRNELPEWREYSYPDSITGDGSGGMRIHPNPCFDEALLVFTLSESASVKIKIYDINGRTILISETPGPVSGSQQIKINVQGLASGCYFAYLKTSHENQITKFLVLR